MAFSDVFFLFQDNKASFWPYQPRRCAFTDSPVRLKFQSNFAHELYLRNTNTQYCSFGVRIEVILLINVSLYCRVPSSEAVDTIVVTMEDYYNDFLHMKSR